MDKLTGLLLGPPRVLLNDEVVNLPFKQAEALLYYLLVEHEVSRSKAADLISAGRLTLNYKECVKPDRTVAEGDVITCRGLGKCVLKEVSGPSKKGRTMIVIERYV